MNETHCWRDVAVAAALAEACRKPAHAILIEVLPFLATSYACVRAGVTLDGANEHVVPWDATRPSLAEIDASEQPDLGVML